LLVRLLLRLYKCVININALQIPPYVARPTRTTRGQNRNSFIPISCNDRDGQALQWRKEDGQALQWLKEDGQVLQWLKEDGQALQWLREDRQALQWLKENGEALQ
jgi:hypothetical protein